MPAVGCQDHTKPFMLRTFYVSTFFAFCSALPRPSFDAFFSGQDANFLGPVGKGARPTLQQTQKGRLSERLSTLDVRVVDVNFDGTDVTNFRSGLGYSDPSGSSLHRRRNAAP